MRTIQVLERCDSMTQAHARSAILRHRGIQCSWTVYSSGLIIIEYSLTVGRERRVA